MNTEPQKEADQDISPSLRNNFRDQLNELSTKTSAHIKFDDLEIGVEYKIHKFGIFEGSKYGGSRVTIHIQDGFLILPERFDKILENAEYQQMIDSGISIVFGGRDKSNGNRLNITFV